MRYTNIVKRTIVALITMTMAFASSQAQRTMLDLSGIWQSSLGECRLPGTTDENRLGGERVMSGPTSQLTRLYPYTGIVTYERDITIPAELTDRHLALILERTKPSTLWIDGDSIGSNGQLFAPHIYNLPTLSAGSHHVKIRIDNSDSAVPSGVHGSHAWSDATQTNWNGVIGTFAIIATANTYIADMQLYPDVEMNEVTVKLYVRSDKGTTCDIHLRRSTFIDETDDECAVSDAFTLNEGDNNIEMRIDMGENPRLWSEFHPDLYSVTACVQTKSGIDTLTKQFGMRRFSTEGTQFVINDNYTFLRGTHDGCVFPLTGYAPADVEAWRRLYKIAKQYGFNHFRFHSYTPTEAAFQAADEEGIYLHTELPLWGTIDSTTVAQNEFLRREAFSVLSFLGNHPSFVSLGLGNELWGDTAIMHRWLDDFRTVDTRHLYSMGSNNDLGWKGPKSGEDFYITCRVGGSDDFSTHVRTSFSFADAENGGILNSTRPNTMLCFDGAVERCSTPIVSHESGQFQVYPDYKELPKYTGVLYPYNLETFRHRLAENGLTAQAEAFHEATGKWAVDCYKADIEYCMRTNGFGGYEMLDIKDYPGQGSALVGILDAFMDSKGLVEPDVFSGWNAPIVPMAMFATHCYTTADSLKADLIVANYSEDHYRQPLSWTLATHEGTCLKSGKIDFVDVWQGQVMPVGALSIPLCDTTQSTQLRLTLTTGSATNYYDLWCYTDRPSYQPSTAHPVLEADTLSADVVKALQKGQTVLLVPNHKSIEQQSVGGLFTPDYWNYAMFKTISENNHKPVSPGTLGMLMNPSHPLFSTFPTDGRTNWQWWSVALASRPLILNTLSKDYRPIIQTVDNVERNHKLGILMELCVGKGKLLICTTDLNGIANTPEGRAYADAVRRYAHSSEFNPTTQISVEQLRALLYSSAKTRNIQGVKNITDYKQQ